jgi:hypothetical protein
MEKNQFDLIIKEFRDIKNLLITLLRQNEVKEENIAHALGIKHARLSQILPQKPNKKGAKNDK